MEKLSKNISQMTTEKIKKELEGLESTPKAGMISNLATSINNILSGLGGGAIILIILKKTQSKGLQN